MIGITAVDVGEIDMFGRENGVVLTETNLLVVVAVLLGIVTTVLTFG